MCSMCSHDVDVEVVLPEAQLGLLQDAYPGPHGDPNALQALLGHVRQLDHADVLVFEILRITLRNEKIKSL